MIFKERLSSIYIFFHLFIDHSHLEYSIMRVVSLSLNIGCRNMGAALCRSVVDHWKRPMPFYRRLIFSTPSPVSIRRKAGGGVVAKKDDSKQSVGVFQCIFIQPWSCYIQTAYKISFFEILVVTCWRPWPLGSSWGSVKTSGGLFISMIGKNFILLLTKLLDDE